MKIHYKPLSRIFPEAHPRKGEQTFFIEKIWRSLQVDGKPTVEMEKYIVAYCQYLNATKQLTDEYIKGTENINPKPHTIRSANKVKVGDFIQFFCWSGKPYRSRWIRPLPPIEVKKVWDFEIKYHGFYLNEEPCGLRMDIISANDGLNHKDLCDWFEYPKPFAGQIICWNENIDY